MEFDRLFAEHYDSVVWFFRRHGFSDQEALDLAQDTFLKAHQGADGFRGEADVKTWLYVIAANVYRNEIRHRRAQRRDAKTVSLDLKPDDSSDRSLSLESSKAVAQPCRQLDELYARDRLRRVGQLVPRLPPRMQEIFKLRMWKHHSYGEIAALMQVSIQTVKSQIHQARRRLAGLLDEDSGGVRGNERRSTKAAGDR